MTSRPAYDRSSLTPDVVHIGPGVFHRAHQAVYSDVLLRAGSRSGAILALSMRSRGVRDALADDDFVYPVLERQGTPDADGSTRVVEIGSIVGIDVVADDIHGALAHLTAPTTTVVTLTVTEQGYCAISPGEHLDVGHPAILHDLAAPSEPRSLPGLLVEALARRRAAGRPPFAVVSCDNLPSNGRSTRRVVVDYAALARPELARWIEADVAFPDSMVDRMVPTTTDAVRASARSFGVSDAWPIVTEPFSQWVLQDTFPHGRPPWEDAGVEIVGDVHRHEQAKLRILNAAHSALAYWGILAGHRTIAEAVADPVLAAAVRALLEREAVPMLDAPPGWDLATYSEQTLARFGNASLPYTTAKVAGDGSQKLVVRLMPTVHAVLAAGRPAPACTAVLAAWAACLASPAVMGARVEDVPAAERLQTTARSPDEVVPQLLTMPGFLDLEDSRHRRFLADVVATARQVWQTPSDAVHRLARHVAGATPSDTPHTDLPEVRP